MQCPVCKQSSLVMSERQGIEIDYCPECRGVWLDRGELDKIIERTLEVSSATENREPVHRQPAVQRDEHIYYDDDYYKKHGKHRKRRGFLGDIFDFD